jgi:mRNA-degrading endonuclease toxin of MazEF toxin-antitoxin module
MRQAFAKVAKPNGVFAGQIYLVPDALLTFADPDPARRTRHPNRPVLVVQGDDHGHNHRCRSVLVMPLSHDTQNQRPWEDVIEESETPLSEPSVVKVHLIQPIPREALLDDSRWVGDLDEYVLARIMAHLVTNLSLDD